MSSIAKPTVVFSNSLTPTIAVPVEQVLDIRKIDYNNSTTNNNTGSTHAIVFDLFDPNNRLAGRAGEIFIPFSTLAARDTSFTNYITAMALTVA